MKANYYVIYFIIYFLVICIQFTTSYINHTAVCFVITRPEQTMFEFVGELALDGLKYGLEIFIMIDDDQFEIPISWIPLYVQTLHISNETCFQNGIEEQHSYTHGHLKLHHGIRHCSIFVN